MKNTVRIYQNGMVRVGRDLLGKLAGDLRLRFKVEQLQQGKVLVLIPGQKPPGWPVTYFAKSAKSPSLSLVPFLKLYNLPRDYFPVGEFEAFCTARGIVVDFDRQKKGRK